MLTVSVCSASISDDIKEAFNTKNGQELLETLGSKPEYIDELLKLANDEKVPDVKKWAIIVAASKLNKEKTLPLIKDLF